MWTLADDILQLSVSEASAANVTQPLHSNKEGTAALRGNLDQRWGVDQARADLLKPSSDRILTLSAERLELLDDASRDGFACRRAEPDPPQAR